MMKPEEGGGVCEELHAAWHAGCTSEFLPVASVHFGKRN
jgi:hypothetical protein